MRRTFLSLCLALSLIIGQRGAASAFIGPPSRSPALASSPDFSVSAPLPPPAGSPARAPLSPELMRRFEPSFLKRLLAAEGTAPLRGIVLMREQAEPGGLAVQATDPLSRRTAIVDRLQNLADRSQSRVRALLEQARQEHKVVTYRPLWIVNALVVEAQQEVFWQLAEQPEVALLREDRAWRLDDPGLTAPVTDPDAIAAGDVQWNVARIQADRVWEALRITGQGVVVANMDSGVDWQHPELMARYRGYAGKPVVVHQGNWHCATDEGYEYPGDGLGHGTHTMGVMVGQNGIGVAPGAEWIAVKVFDNQGWTYESWIHDGFQWILAPGGDPALAPDVVNNSWGSDLNSSEEFLPDVRALRTAGILPVFAAGNKGPDSGTVQSPGSFRESLAVGAVDSQDLIALFSGRGPSPWGEIKPEITAPGVGVLSTAPGGGRSTGSGTSIAAPHAAGVAALMLQANPLLTVEELETILIGTAWPLGNPHPNNAYGWGLVDAYAAVAQAGGFGRLVGQVTEAGNGAAIPNASVAALADDARATALTNGSGRYTMGLGSGVYDVTLTAFGYVTHTVSHVAVQAGMTTSLDVAMTALPVGVLQGIVREAATNQPLLATISVPGASPTAIANPGSGAYSLSLPEGTHTVRVECTAHRFQTATVTIRSGGRAYQDFALEPAPRMLLVDSGAWYNGSERGYYESALEGLRYLYDRHVIAGLDYSRVPTAGTLLPYDLVIWSAPQDAPGYIGATDAISAYLRNGGRILLSGQDVAFWDGGGNKRFYAPYFEPYLKAAFVDDSAPTRQLDGVGDLFAGLTITIAGAGGANNQFSPDVIRLTEEDHALTAWTYHQDGSGGQAVGPCLAYRVLYLSFGFEAINDAVAREQVLERSIDWLMGPPRQEGLELKAAQLPQIERSGGSITHTVRLRNVGETMTDTYALSLSDATWPTSLEGPPRIELGACQSSTVQVSVNVPIGIGWHTFDTATLTARSIISPLLTATASLVSKTPAPVLLVDGERFYHLEQRYQTALEASGIGYDYRRIKDVWPPSIPTTDTLSMYPIVVWYTGYDWYDPLDSEEESRLMAYLDGGGRLFLSAQDYLYYGDGHPLARHYLGVLGYSESLTATVATGEIGNPIGWGLGPYTLTYPYRNWSDALAPDGDAQVTLRGEHGLPIGLTQRGDRWRTAFWAFPFEALDPDAAKVAMSRTVGWLSWLGASTWEADQRTVSSGSTITMTCRLRNDGWSDVQPTHFSATLPSELSLYPESLTGGAIYYPLTRAVTWEGSLARNEEREIRLRVQVADPLPDGSSLPFPATIGYADHGLSFERPYILRVNSPDLSPSSLAVEPSHAHLAQVLTYTLMVRNIGVRDAVATVAATAPYGTIFTGTLDSGGTGSGAVVSQTLSWSGLVVAHGMVTLSYQLAVGQVDEGLLAHTVQLQDQYGEIWHVQAYAEMRPWQSYLPWLPRGR